MVSVSRRAGPPQAGQVVFTHSVWRASGLSPPSPGLEVGNVRQAQRQLAFRQGHPAAVLAVNHGDGLAPVALAAEHPVAQLEVGFRLADALSLFHQPPRDGLFGLFYAHAVQKAAVHHYARGTVGERLPSARRRPSPLPRYHSRIFGQIPSRAHRARAQP